jgi:tetratricopeptide (TPR) repeat protein/transcriptional regulator with XRE-family HTH domain
VRAGYQFGRLLRSYRIAACLTQEELAHRSGLSVRTLSNLERGTATPFIRSVRLLADALDLPDNRRAQLISAVSDGITPADPAEPPDARPGRYLQAVVPRQLPAAVAHFEGRAAELRLLADLLGSAPAGGHAVMISAIGGTAGVGKTSLAVHFAHQVAAGFPDGQLYLNLRGFGPSADPVSPEEAVRGFLDALGVPSGHVPAGLDQQAALYRSLLADKQMLVLLDNARDEQQLRPLLPAGPGCLVIVTSRRQLSGLAAAQAALLLSLDVLSDAESLRLLTARLGAARVAAEPAAAGELISLCARLPLALSVASARAVTRPGLPLAALAAELRDSSGRLDVLDAGDAAASVRAVFSWSYQNLSEPAARMFRLLGVHSGPDISLPAAASLAGLPRRRAGALLGELTSANLLAEQAQDRYGFHDLLRAYAAGQAAAADGEAGRRAAIGRVLDHYLHTAHQAFLRLDPAHRPIALARAQPGVSPEALAEDEQAMAWLQAEQQALLGAITQAADGGFDAHAWQLPWTLTAFFDRRGRWQDIIATQRIALAAARRLGEVTVQAHAHHQIGRAFTRLGQPIAAGGHELRAVSLFARIGDKDGQALAHIGIGWTLSDHGRYDGALDHAGQALELFRAAGDRHGQAGALNNLGWYHILAGNVPAGIGYGRRSGDLFRELGIRSGEAITWDTIGNGYHRLGDQPRAIDCYQSAVRLFRGLGDYYHLADTLANLGDAQLGAGRPEAAAGSWREALAVFADLHHPAAAQVRAKLAAVEGGDQAPPVTG